jgi:hypothetical protein
VEQVATLEIGKWYNLQLALDFDARTYSGALASRTDRAEILERPFVGAAQPINGVYSDGGTSFLPGTAPDHDLDNWALSDAPLTGISGGAYVQSTSPKGSDVSNKSPIVIELVDAETSVAPDSIQLFLNDEKVTPSISADAGTTTVTYAPPADLRPGVYNVRLAYGDNSTPQVVKQTDFSFTVPGPSVISFSPTGEGNSSDRPVAISIMDKNTKVAPGSIKLYVNDALAAATISKPAGSDVTEITYAPAGGFAPGSENNVRLEFTDDSTPAIATTKTFSFSVVDSGLASSVINIDFKGIRNVPGPDALAPTFEGIGAAGGGKVFNGLVANSQLEDGTDDDLLTVTGENLLNSLGGATTVGFTVSPMGGDVGGAPTTDPTATAALFSDYIFNNSAGNQAGESPFTISGLGDVPFVDLYFYRSSGGITISGSAPSSFTGGAVFTSGNTVYFSHVPVVDGQIAGAFGSGTAVIQGMTIVKPLPQPFVKSVSPIGEGAPPESSITIQLQDYVTQVNPGSIQLLLNGVAVTPSSISKDADSAVTTVTYTPAGGFAQGSSYTAKLTFADNATPAAVQSTEFSFTVLSEASAALTVNIDIDGARNVPGPRGPGPTYVGVGPAGGGSAWNGILADSRLEDGTDEDNLTVGAENLLNSLGAPTSIAFTISPVGGDDGGAPAGTDVTSPAALLGDYLFVGSAGQFTGLAEFNISGLGDAPFVDVYMIFGAEGVITMPGGPAAPFSGAGIFTAGNTKFFRKVPVENGAIVGTIGSGGNIATLIYGLTIQKPLPQPFVVSVSPNVSPSAKVRTNDVGVISIQLQDYGSKVVPGSIEFSLNGQTVSPQITTDSAKGLTTVSFDSYEQLALDALNTVRLVFSDDATPSLKQTNEFSFYVVSEATIGRIVNIDFNGSRQPDEPNPTFEGVGPAGGGTVFNGIAADSRLETGGDNDNLTVSGQNLLNSYGAATAVGFTVTPVGGDVGGAPTTDPASTGALFSDYIFNNSAGNVAGQSPFSITGLGDAATADLYFFKGPGSVTIPGSTAVPFAGSGIFTPANTVYFSGVPVVNGKVEGSIGGGTTVIYGLTIVWSGPATGTVGPIHIARDGNEVVITWDGAGVLQSATEIDGAWGDIQSATSPHHVTLPATAGAQFFRLRN